MSNQTTTKENTSLEEVAFSISRYFSKLYLDLANIESIRKTVFDNNNRTVLISDERKGASVLIMGKLRTDYNDSEIYHLYQPNFNRNFIDRIFWYNDLRGLYVECALGFDISLKKEESR